MCSWWWGIAIGGYASEASKGYGGVPADGRSTALTAKAAGTYMINVCAQTEMMGGLKKCSSVKLVAVDVSIKVGGKLVEKDPNSFTPKFKPSYVPAGAEVAYSTEVSALPGDTTASYIWQMAGVNGEAKQEVKYTYTNPGEYKPKVEIQTKCGWDGYRCGFIVQEVPVRAFGVEIDDVETPCESLTDNPCTTDSFVMKRDRSGDLIKVTAKIVPSEFQDYVLLHHGSDIRYECGNLVDGEIAENTCTVRAGTPLEYRFIPNIPFVAAGRTEPLTFRVKAQVMYNDKVANEAPIDITQDELDQLRQQYHDLSNQFHPNGKREKPERSEFVSADTYVDPGNFAFETINQNANQNIMIITAWAMFDISNNAQDVRTAINWALTVNSAYRNPLFNDSLNNSDFDSPHIFGDAIDTHIQGASATAATSAGVL